MLLSPPSSSPDSTTNPERFFLAADVGGTHARVGLVRVRHAAPNACPVELVHSERYLNADWPGLAEILLDFTAKLADTPWRDTRALSGVLACAGYVQGDQVINRNLPWPVFISSTRERLGMQHLATINDFEALAHAVPYVGATDMRTLMSGDKAVGGLAVGPVVVMGPGTGLGCAIILPNSPAPRVLATEAAHIALAPGTPREIEILRMLASEQPHVPVEYALSGPGLLKLYRAISMLRGQPATLSTPASVTAAALDESCPAALEALHTFCALLGSFAADLAALYSASGGIMLAGGILPRIEDFLWKSEFKARFLRKGVMTPFLQRVPVHLIDHGELGVIGAACWLEQMSLSSGE